MLTPLAFTPWHSTQTLRNKDLPLLIASVSPVRGFPDGFVDCPSTASGPKLGPIGGRNARVKAMMHDPQRTFPIIVGIPGGISDSGPASSANVLSAGSQMDPEIRPERLVEPSIPRIRKWNPRRTTAPGQERRWGRPVPRRARRCRRARHSPEPKAIVGRASRFVIPSDARNLDAIVRTAASGPPS